MHTATFHFLGDLPFFLTNDSNGVTTPIYPPVSVKHVIESLGVPHTEVGAIGVNGRWQSNGRFVDFAYLVQPDDTVHIYPLPLPQDVSPEVILRPPLPHNPPHFVLDNHLGRLARYLRLLGFDAHYPPDHFSDAELAQLAHDEARVMLTRDRGLLMRNLVTHGYCLRTKNSKAQLMAVLDRFELRDQIQAWTRCLRCNGRLALVPKADIIDRLEPKTKKYFDEFHICQACGQIYWKGSHYRPLLDLVQQAKQNQKEKACANPARG